MFNTPEEFITFMKRFTDDCSDIISFAKKRAIETPKSECLDEAANFLKTPIFGFVEKRIFNNGDKEGYYIWVEDVRPSGAKFGHWELVSNAIKFPRGARHSLLTPEQLWVINNYCTPDLSEGLRQAVQSSQTLSCRDENGRYVLIDLPFDYGIHKIYSLLKDAWKLINDPDNIHQVTWIYMKPETYKSLLEKLDEVPEIAAREISCTNEKRDKGLSKIIDHIYSCTDLLRIKSRDSFFIHDDKKVMEHNNFYLVRERIRKAKKKAKKLLKEDE